MAYADFTYYSTSYLGNVIAEADFPRLALLASAQIDRITFQRAASDTENTTAIKNAMCAVAEAIYRQELAGGADAITSESQGRYSVSYAANSSRARTNDERIRDAARVWLDGTFLMFPGFFSGEYSGDSE